MRGLRKRLAHTVLVAAAMTTIGLVVPDRAGAQSYPNRPIKLIANGSPGGVIDTIGRVTASTLSPLIGTQVWSRIDRVLPASSAPRLS